MKKILSVMLIFVLSLFVVATTDVLQAEATEAVTITLHVHQFDGDYTNTGTGIWDGVTWNDWNDVQSSVDDFGAVIVKNYTAAEINAVADLVEFKPTRNVNNDDNTLEGGLAANMNYLAPDSIEGKVFLDVTALKDGSETELHAYYVEGAKDFYVVEGTPVNGMFFNVYANPEVAADDMVYDGWGMHTWNNDQPDVDWGENPLQYEIEMELESSVGWIPARLGMLEVGVSAVGDAGFIAHKGDEKSCADNMYFSTNDLLAADGKAQVVYYEHGACDFAPDYATFIGNVATQFEINSGNRLVEGTQIVAPNEMEVSMLMAKPYDELLADRFRVTDADGNDIPVTGIDYPGMAIGAYESGVVVQTETLVVVYLDTEVDHTNLGLVGSMQGWAPENAILSFGDVNGYAVFEFTSFDAVAEFKILTDDVQTDDPATDWVVEDVGFDWGDTSVSGNDNVVVDLSAGGTIEVVIDDATDTATVSELAPQDVDIANFTYTSGVTCAAEENLFTLFLDTELDPAKIGLVGSIQEATPWTPATPIMSTGVTDGGEVVFEVCATGTSFEYKVLYDPDGDGWIWDSTVDPELVRANVALDFGDGTTGGEIAHLIDAPVTHLNAYTPTLTATSIYRLSVYVDIEGDLDPTKLGLVGTVNGWDVENPILANKMDAFGHYIFDVELNSKTGEYAIVYDDEVDDPATTEVDESGFDWDDKISGNDNIAFDLGGDATLVQLATIDAEMAMTFTDLGADISEYVASSVTLMFADEAFMFDGAYTVYYEDIPPYDINQMWVDNDGNVYDFTYTDITTVDFTKGIGQGWAFIKVNFDADTVAGMDTLTVTVDGPSGEQVIIKPNDNSAIEEWVTFGDEPVTHTWTEDAFTWLLIFGAPGTDNVSGQFEILEATLSSSTAISEIMFENVPVILDNNFVEGNFVEGTGTFAIDQENIQVVFENAVLPMEGLMLQMTDGTEILMDTYMTAAMVGDYTSTVTCDAGNLLLTVHVDTRTYDTTDLTKFGIVGTINGWDVGGSLAPTGLDSKGNVVFEVCVPDIAGDEVFISEYIEGSSSNKAVELFNPTDAEIDLTGYTVEAYNNGSTEVTNSLDLTGQVIPAGGTFVIYNSGADQAILDVGDIDSTITYFNGDDAVVLKKDGVVIDIIGLVGEDPGSNWPVGDGSTGEHTLYRASNVASGNPVFDPSEWVVAEQNTFDGLGEHALAAPSGEFKVKFDTAGDGFTWDGSSDPEITPGNILFNFANGDHVLVVEGQSAADVDYMHFISVATADAFTKDGEYELVFMDGSGFEVSIPLLIDNQAPAIDQKEVVGVTFTYDPSGDAFDIMDYYTVLRFIDNRDGVLEYTIDTNLDATTPGEQTVVISATDSWGNKGTFEIVIDVIDIWDPVITGDTEVTFTAGDAEPTWEDYVTVEGGTLSVNTDQVDMDTEGTFFVLFSAVDEAGNTATHTLEVTIEAAPETGCFSSFSLGSSLIMITAVLGGAVLFFVRKK
ncbi:lamin tail domain-containing protein [Candidatus Xianfuyuplasma coldseepsis]|uniref:Lamin tail domain-containing protein n=1 Tax=Candidatus Xianfuyuplasma coldseepsis TaxID=2782163 RepID=A0A7L7KPW8_9MOLU|nr:lamin tail domain-containing protein [Xianfuyuplasma coldseepsis]QMS84226.1 lamin tail domain-containing protein [Xianfuyuplasma coldseepsis]